jgi:hypothetical protein
MKASELKTGRTFGVTFQHGDEFMACLASFCRENEVRQGCTPTFLAGSSRPTSSAPARSRKIRGPGVDEGACNNVEALGAARSPAMMRAGPCRESARCQSHFARTDFIRVVRLFTPARICN